MTFRKPKATQVHTLILEYCEVVGRAVSSYKHLIDDYLVWDKHFKEVAKEVRKTESEADDLLKQIQRTMLEGAMLPAYREDYISLLELLDKVANTAEDVAQTLRLIRPDIPEEIRPYFAQVVDLTVEQWAPVPDMIAGLLEGRSGLIEAAEFLDKKEGQIDKIQRSTTRIVFRDLQLRLSHQMLLKELLDQTCHVSDRIEDVGDRISLIAIKHAL